MSTSEAYSMTESYGGSSMSGLGGIFAGAMILTVVMVIVCIIAYVVNAIGIYKFLKMTQYDKCWCAYE